MIFGNPYFNNLTKIELLQKWILVHSAIYYEFDMSVVSDHMYDMNMVQLVKLMEDFPKDAKKSRFAYCFKGFEGGTGFDLMKKLRKHDSIEIKKTAQLVMELAEKRKR